MSDILEAVGLSEAVEPVAADKVFSILTRYLVAGWPGAVECPCCVTWDGANCAELDRVALFVECLELGC